MKTENDIFSKYAIAYLEKLETCANLFKLIGMGEHENPKWLQYRGVSDSHRELGVKNHLYFKSSQCPVGFLIPIENDEDFHFFVCSYSEAYDYFKALRKKHLSENHPTINQ